MGFIATLLGWRELLTYGITFNQPRLAVHYTRDPDMARDLLRASTGDQDLELSPEGAASIRLEGFKIVPREGTQIAARVTASSSSAPATEQIRLWAHYQTKLQFNLGRDTTSDHILSGLALITASDFTRDTDCIALVGDELGIRFVPETSPVRTHFSGKFYAKGSIHRMIQTHFPYAVDNSLLWLSGVGLVQAAVVANSDDDEALGVLTRTARNLLELLSSRRAISPSDLSQLPEIAYMRAMGAT